MLSRQSYHHLSPDSTVLDLFPERFSGHPRKISHAPVMERENKRELYNLSRLCSSLIVKGEKQLRRNSSMFPPGSLSESEAEVVPEHSALPSIPK